MAVSLVVRSQTWTSFLTSSFSPVLRPLRPSRYVRFSDSVDVAGPAAVYDYNEYDNMFKDSTDKISVPIFTPVVDITDNISDCGSEESMYTRELPFVSNVHSSFSSYNSFSPLFEGITPNCTVPTDSSSSLLSDSDLELTLSFAKSKTAPENPKTSKIPYVDWNRPKQFIHGQGANQIDLDICIQDLTPHGKTVRTKALLDSDCTGSVIDPDFVEKHYLPVYPLRVAVKAINADGSSGSSGLITHVTKLSMSIGGHNDKIMFGITKLGTHSIYLSFDWLQLHNPVVNWSNKKLYFTRCPSFFNYVTKLYNPEEDEEEVEEVRNGKEEEVLEAKDRLDPGDRVFMFSMESYTCAI